MPTYQKADAPTNALLKEVRGAYHGRLSDVTISILMAHATVNEDGERVGHAIMHHGAPALAKVRIVPLRDRVHGLSDAEIIVDGDEWPTTSEKTKRALLDHELTHLLGVGKVDDIGRPKLKLRAQVGWFHEVAERHGAHSVEVRQASQLVDERGQTYFGFMDIRKGRAA